MPIPRLPKGDLPMKRTNDDRIPRIALELSLKPFGRDDGRTFAECARHVITAWRPLLEAADEVSFMLWVADGSEILEWRGDPRRPLEWARYIGFANPSRDAYDVRHHPPSRGAIPFDPQPRDLCYADLHAIIVALRKEGAALLARPISIGATFDPGPEFAESPFKYDRHREIIVPKRVSGRPTFPMVDAAAALHADPEPYAAYPKGIPEGEPFARFLGGQIAAFCRDLGFDYVWLSNGFGFSPVAWDYLGPGFDGERFLPEARAERLARFKRAWEDLVAGNPEIPMEVRGSNFAAGMDIAKDGVDFAWLYDRGIIRLPPPNSPWGALNFDFGLEIAGFLSRAVRSPHGEVLFRYYPNDPWFWQNPWTDVFYGEPYDIYLPLATGVIDAAGAITTPSVINILTGDTEFGETDPLTGVQVGAQIRTALAERPDDVGLVTWIYPFDAYHRLAAEGAEGQAEVFFGDWFVRSAINHGLPVATAATPAALDAFLAERGGAPETVLFMPTAAARTAPDAARLLDWLARGIPAILYGPASSLDATLLDYLGLALTEPLAGEFTLVDAHGSAIGPLFHDPIGSAGGIAARAAGDAARLRYAVTQDGETWAYGASATADGAAPLIWIRGTNAFETRPDPERLALKPQPQAPRYLDAGALCAAALRELGYTIDVQGAAPGAALMLFSRHDNAWFLSGYAEAPVGEVALKFPAGAPLFHATYTRLADGAAHYPLARTLRRECRVFVQQAAGIVGCTTGPRDEHHTELTLKITGLQDATVTFLPPQGVPVTFEHDGAQRRFVAPTQVAQAGLSGELVIRW
jgi:hypothetical protein